MKDVTFKKATLKPVDDKTSLVWILSSHCRLVVQSGGFTIACFEKFGKSVSKSVLNVSEGETVDFKPKELSIVSKSF